jgi:hypothetical protein
MSVSRNGNIEIAQLLINKRANLNLQNSNGKTALMLACEYNTDNKIDTIQLLVNARADLNLIDNNGRSALMIACMNFKLSVSEKLISMLIIEGTNLDIVDNTGKKVTDYIMKYNIIDLYTSAIINKTKLDTYKELAFKNVLKSIPTQSKIIRYSPGNMGYEVTNLNFKLKLDIHEDIFANIDTKLIDYLSICNSHDMVAKVIEYLNNY